VNEARGAKDTLGILFWGVMHKRFGVITSWDFCYDLKYLLSNVEQFKPLRFILSCLLHPRSPTHPSTLISEPGRVFWGADEELSDGGSPQVIVYGYDGLPMQPVALPFPDYVPEPEHLPFPDYMPGPEHPPSPVEVPYVPEPEYLEYLVPSDDEAPLEDQPLPANASPTALSPGYVADFDPDEDPEEDPVEDHADYPADEGDGKDEPSDDDDDDDDTDDENEEPFEDEDDDEDEDEHLAPADSSAIPVVDPIPSAGDAEAFETDEDAPTPVEVKRLLALPIPPPSPLSPWSSPLPQIPSPPLPALPSSLHLPPLVPASLPLPSSPLPLLPASLSIPPLVDHREDTPEAELLPRKRLCLTTPTSRNEVDPTEAVEEVALTTLEGVNARVTKLAAVQEQDT
ncbi:hypothetical protein Tco_0687036, partial [Tanacetum coccineum]